MGSPLKTYFHGSMQEVCRLVCSPPQLQQSFLAEVFALLVLESTRPLQR